MKPLSYESLSRHIDPFNPHGSQAVGHSQAVDDAGPRDARGASTTETAEIVAEFLRTAHLMRCLLSSQFTAFGLTETWFSVLEILSRTAPGGCSQRELAAALGQSESSVSTLIERMRSHGLLHRLRSKTDRRKHVLMMTERGQTTCSTVRQFHHQRTAQLLSGLRASELGTFSELLNRLGTELVRIKFSREAGTLRKEETLAIPDSGVSREILGPDDQRKSAA